VLTFDGSKAKVEAKMEPKTPEVADEKPTGVVFKGNTIRGEGEMPCIKRRKTYRG